MGQERRFPLPAGYAGNPQEVGTAANWRKVPRERRWTSAGATPGLNCIAPRDGNRSRLFLGNEKHSVFGIFLRQPGATSSFAGGFESPDSDRQDASELPAILCESPK
jgi:hypothetical protein